PRARRRRRPAALPLAHSLDPRRPRRNRPPTLRPGRPRRRIRDDRHPTRPVLKGPPEMIAFDARISPDHAQPYPPITADPARRLSDTCRDEAPVFAGGVSRRGDRLAARADYPAPADPGARADLAGRPFHVSKK